MAWSDIKPDIGDTHVDDDGDFQLQSFLVGMITNDSRYSSGSFIPRMRRLFAPFTMRMIPSVASNLILSEESMVSEPSIAEVTEPVVIPPHTCLIVSS